MPVYEATAHNITQVVYREWMHTRYLLMADNMYVSWHNEMDIFGLRKSGFCDEFEIKHSVSDFKADFKKSEVIKCDESYTPPYQPCTHRDCYHCKGTDVRTDGSQCGYQPRTYRRKTKRVNKHDALADGTGIPNYFAFVIPEDIEGKIEVPDHAGLYVCRFDSPYGRLDEIKRPPRLHNRKLKDATVNKIARKLSVRYWEGKVLHEAKT